MIPEEDKDKVRLVGHKVTELIDTLGSEVLERLVLYNTMSKWAMKFSKYTDTPIEEAFKKISDDFMDFVLLGTKIHMTKGVHGEVEITVENGHTDIVHRRDKEKEDDDNETIKTRHDFVCKGLISAYDSLNKAMDDAGGVPFDLDRLLNSPIPCLNFYPFAVRPTILDFIIPQRKRK